MASTEDLGKIAPGFTAQKTIYGLPVFFIRGIGFFDTTLGVSPAVTIYSDQQPLPYSPMSRGAILDLERVEVLKGPQGTLFGQNSTGGAVNFIAAKPTESLQAGLVLTGGRFGEMDAEGYVSGPISNTLTARLAVREETRGDWQRGYTTDERIGQKNFQNSRLLLDWKPSSSVKFELEATGWRDRSDSQMAQLVAYTPLSTPANGGRPPSFPTPSFPVAPNNDRAAAWDQGYDFRHDDWFYQFGLRGDIRLADWLTMTSLTSYERFSTNIPIDFDATTYPADRTSSTGRIESFSQEIRLSGSLGDHTQIMVGANYQHDRVIERQIDGPIDQSGTIIGTNTFNDFYLDNDQRVSTKSAFASVDYKLTGTLTVQASARYTAQDRSFAGCTRDPGDGEIATAFAGLSSALTGSPQTIAPGACVTLSDANTPIHGVVQKALDQNNVSWRAGLNWKPTVDTLFYANITKGFKAGSFPTLPAASSSQLNPVTQESVLAYEAGTKLALFQKIAQLDAAVFYYDYRNKQLLGYQLIAPFGPLAALVTIPKSRVVGAEANLVVRPTDRLRLSVGETYVDSKVTQDPPNATGPFGNGGSFVGDRFPYTPRWQGVADAQYTMPLSAKLDGFVGAALTSRSGTATALLTGATAVAGQEGLLHIAGYTLLDLRAGVEGDAGQWRLEFWARNVTNKFYANSVTRFTDVVTRYAGMPATYGVTLNLKFKP